MPLKFVTRYLKSNAYYHVYNQGLGKKEIFIDEQDYKTFLYYLDIYTLPKEEVESKYPDLPRRLKSKNLSDEIKLVAYCLMPDHFHILIKQQSSDALPKLIKQITNGYTTYFNKKYKKVGGVVAGRYKAVIIESEFVIIEMVRYVHLNPVTGGLVTDPREYQWSSINNHSPSNDLFNYFGTVLEWDKFHLDKEGYFHGREKLKNYTIEVI